MERFAIKAVISSIDTIQHAVLTFACPRDSAEVYALAVESDFTKRVEAGYMVRFQELRIYDALSQNWLKFSKPSGSLETSKSGSWPWYEDGTCADWAKNRINYRPYDTKWENTYYFASGARYTCFMNDKAKSMEYLD